MIPSRDGLDSEKRDYLARFFGFACALGLCGVGGVESILRSTSSSLGGTGEGFGLLIGVARRGGARRGLE